MNFMDENILEGLPWVGLLVVFSSSPGCRVGQDRVARPAHHDRLENPLWWARARLGSLVPPYSLVGFLLFAGVSALFRPVVLTTIALLSVSSCGCCLYAARVAPGDWHYHSSCQCGESGDFATVPTSDGATVPAWCPIVPNRPPTTPPCEYPFRRDFSLMQFRTNRNAAPISQESNQSVRKRPHTPLISRRASRSIGRRSNQSSRKPGLCSRSRYPIADSWKETGSHWQQSCSSPVETRKAPQLQWLESCGHPWATSSWSTTSSSASRRCWLIRATSASPSLGSDRSRPLSDVPGSPLRQRRGLGFQPLGHRRKLSAAVRRGRRLFDAALGERLAEAAVSELLANLKKSVEESGLAEAAVG